MPSPNINLTAINGEITPFPHFYTTDVLQNNLEEILFDWFENTSLWRLKKTNFYEQYEFDFLNADLPINLNFLVENKTLEMLIENIQNQLSVGSLQLVGIAAHKLVEGHYIGIHNDYINDKETHRIVLHINPFWKEENGGILMLFNSANPDDVNKLVLPINNSAFGFEISQHSYHAVSKIYNSPRYTIVYTFRRA